MKNISLISAKNCYYQLSTNPNLTQEHNPDNSYFSKEEAPITRLANNSRQNKNQMLIDRLTRGIQHKPAAQIVTWCVHELNCIKLLASAQSYATGLSISSSIIYYLMQETQMEYPVAWLAANNLMMLFSYQYTPNDKPSNHLELINRSAAKYTKVLLEIVYALEIGNTPHLKSFHNLLTPSQIDKTEILTSSGLSKSLKYILALTPKLYVQHVTALINQDQLEIYLGRKDGTMGKDYHLTFKLAQPQQEQRLLSSNDSQARANLSQEWPAYLSPESLKARKIKHLESLANQRLNSSNILSFPPADQNLKKFITEFNHDKNVTGLVTMLRVGGGPASGFSVAHLEAEAIKRKENYNNNQVLFTNFSATVILPTPLKVNVHGARSHNRLFATSNGFTPYDDITFIQVLDYGFLLNLNQISIHHSLPSARATLNRNYSQARQDYYQNDQRYIVLIDGSTAVINENWEIQHPGLQIRHQRMKNTIPNRTYPVVTISSQPLTKAGYSQFVDKAYIAENNPNLDYYQTARVAYEVFGRDNHNNLRAFLVRKLTDNQEILQRTAKSVSKMKGYHQPSYLLPETLFLPNGNYMDAVRALFIYAEPRSSWNESGKHLFASPLEVKKYLDKLSASESNYYLIKLAQEYNKPIIVMYRDKSNRDMLFDLADVY